MKMEEKSMTLYVYIGCILDGSAESNAFIDK